MLKNLVVLHYKFNFVLFYKHTLLKSFLLVFSIFKLREFHILFGKHFFLFYCLNLVNTNLRRFKRLLIPQNFLIHFVLIIYLLFGRNLDCCGLQISWRFVNNYSSNKFEQTHCYSLFLNAIVYTFCNTQHIFLDCLLLFQISWD